MAKREKAGITPEGTVVTDEAGVNTKGTKGTEGAVPQYAVEGLANPEVFDGENFDGENGGSEGPQITQISADSAGADQGGTEVAGDADAGPSLLPSVVVSELKASEQYRHDEGRKAYERHCEGRAGKEPWEELEPKRQEAWIRAAL